MSTHKVIHCLVDDTALTTNISEIKNWVLKGHITLVVPLYTLGRLHQLKKDASQVGTNAREAVKFLDQVTSGTDGIPEDAITVQGPEEQYNSWPEVEAHYVDEEAGDVKKAEDVPPAQEKPADRPLSANGETTGGRPQSAGGALSQMLLDKLNFVKVPQPTSPNTTPPDSPTSSGPQSSKTSPEVKNASLTTFDKSATPPTLKPLLNSVVWYTYEKKGETDDEPIRFITNSSDTTLLIRGFGIVPKNIYQLRQAIGVDQTGTKHRSRHSQTYPTPPPTAVKDAEPKALLKYEDDSEDDEVVLFKPRGRGMRASASVRGSTASVRGNGTLTRSPIPPFTPPTQTVQTAQNKPQIPTEEIDPDSFDRGSFGRGNTPLTPTSNHVTTPFQGFPRGPNPRGTFAPSGYGSYRGGFYGRGRGSFDRGSARGRGRLFVP